MPDRARLGPDRSGSGHNMGAGTNNVFAMHGTSFTMDRPDHNNPVQPLYHEMPEFFRECGIRDMISIHGASGFLDLIAGFFSYSDSPDSR